MIKEFLQSTELEMFITGAAGTGKTTSLADIITQLDEMKIVYQVVAYTHKAKEVLISKLPLDTPISTLHSWLKKRPGVNEKAKHIRSLVTSKQYGKPEHLQLLIVDEFSFVGEKDYYSIGELQDEFQLEQSLTLTRHCCDKCGHYSNNENRCAKCGSLEMVEEDYLPPNTVVPDPIKVLYIGDPNQLSPVDGVGAVIPCEPFWIKLTHIYRQDSPGLQTPLKYLVEMIEGKRPMKYLEPTEDLLRAIDIDNEFKNLESDSKIMLSYTNKAVQKHNSDIQGYAHPKPGDLVYNSSLRQSLIWEGTSDLHSDDCLVTPDGIIHKDTKYNPLKTLASIKEIIYMKNGNYLYPVIFGVYNNKIIRKKYGEALTKANQKGKASKKEYKLYKCLNDYVSVVDFSHCQTIHKSQGQEYDHVFVDSKDLATCWDKNEMLKLLYVAISRSKLKIYLNN